MEAGFSQIQSQHRYKPSPTFGLIASQLGEFAKSKDKIINA